MPAPTLAPVLAPTLAKVVAFGLFLVLGFAAIPLMLRVFLWGQRRIGNESVPMVRFLGDHQTGVVLTVWIVFGLGSRSPCPRCSPTSSSGGRPSSGSRPSCAARAGAC